MTGISHILPLLPALVPLAGTGALTLTRRPSPLAQNARVEAAAGSTRVPWSDFFTVDVRRITSLAAGWDGPGSVQVNENTLLIARLLLGRALDRVRDPIAPYIVPAGDGSVQMEWHEEHGELEFCVGPNGEFSAWAHDHRNELEFEGSGEEAVAIFYRWAPWIATSRGNARDVQPAWETAIFEFAA